MLWTKKLVIYQLIESDMQGPIHMGSQVPSPLMLVTPNMEAKSQLLSIKKTIKYEQLSLKSDLDYFM